MSEAEYPTTDAAEIKQRLDKIESTLGEFAGRFDGQANGINSIGANLQWLVENLQGIFQMFASPQFMSQMSNMIAGGLGNAGQAGPTDATGAASGADPGAA